MDTAVVTIFVIATVVVVALAFGFANSRRS